MPGSSIVPQCVRDIWLTRGRDYSSLTALLGRQMSSFLVHSPLDQWELRLRGSTQGITPQELNLHWALWDDETLDLGPQPDAMIGWDLGEFGRVWGYFAHMGNVNICGQGANGSKLSATWSPNPSPYLVPLQEGHLMSLPLESELALWFILTNRRQWKWHCGFWD